MKKYILLAIFCVATMSGMAQHHHGHTPPPPPATQHHDHHHGHHHGHTQPPQKPVVICATADQMLLVLQVLDKQYSDEKRMDIAMLCVTLGHFCTNDLASIAERFTMESSKVSFLRYAYRYCEDPYNYHTLRSVLRYHSDYDSLMEVVQPEYRRPW
ncbi:MAG: DUF4476 domain-containing protein [Paludibacteraceae bacterium]|nr:DUF4476 domain-containing protein [Paludibacteraceae bacterium]